MNAKVTDMREDVDTSKEHLNGLREKLELLAESIKEPISRISVMEERAGAIEADMHNKVSNHDLYH